MDSWRFSMMAYSSSRKNESRTTVELSVSSIVQQRNNIFSESLAMRGRGSHFQCGILPLNLFNMPKSPNTPSYDFANILFSGKCNAQCPYCIGSKLEKQYPSNLDLYPLPGIEKLIALVKNYAIPEIICTGTTTDPLLYRNQIAL